MKTNLTEEHKLLNRYDCYCSPNCNNLQHSSYKNHQAYLEDQKRGKPANKNKEATTFCQLCTDGNGNLMPNWSTKHSITYFQAHSRPQDHKEHLHIYLWSH